MTLKNYDLAINGFKGKDPSGQSFRFRSQFTPFRLLATESKAHTDHVEQRDVVTVFCHQLYSLTTHYKVGLLNILLPWQIQAQKETAIIWRECSKKHALSLFEGSVQSCPEPVDGKAANCLLGAAGRNCLAYPEGEYFCVDARSVHEVREHRKMATCLREALRRRQGTPLAAIINIP